jgi:hypothetical protein
MAIVKKLLLAMALMCMLLPVNSAYAMNPAGGAVQGVGRRGVKRKKSLTPEQCLSKAVDDIDLEGVQQALAAGANPRVRAINVRGHEECLPLSTAAELCNSDSHSIIQLLLDARADVNEKGFEDKTPLTGLLYTVAEHYIGDGSYWGEASESESLPARNHDEHYFIKVNPGSNLESYEKNMQVLVGAKADVNLRDEGGNTALHYGAESMCPSVITTLINAKADIQATNDKGETPLKKMINGYKKFVCRTKGSDDSGSGSDDDEELLWIRPNISRAAKMLVIAGALCDDIVPRLRRKERLAVEEGLALRTELEGRWLREEAQPVCRYLTSGVKSAANMLVPEVLMGTVLEYADALALQKDVCIRELITIVIKARRQQQKTENAMLFLGDDAVMPMDLIEASCRYPNSIADRVSILPEIIRERIAGSKRGCSEVDLLSGADSKRQCVEDESALALAVSVPGAAVLPAAAPAVSVSAPQSVVECHVCGYWNAVGARKCEICENKLGGSEQ